MQTKFKKVFFMMVLAVAFWGSLPEVKANTALSQLQTQATNLQDGGTFTLSADAEIDGTLNFSGKSNITIDGNLKKITQIATNMTTIKIQGCTNVTVKNLTLIGDPGSYTGIRNSAKGLFLYGCLGSHTVKDSSFLNHGYAGIEAYNTTDTIVDNCIFKADDVVINFMDNYNAGIYLYMDGCDRWEIKNSDFYTSATGIIVNGDNHDQKVHNNTFTNMRGQHGIYFGACSNVEVYENTFTNIALICIKLQIPEPVTDNRSNVAIYNNIGSNQTRYSGGAGVSIRRVGGSQYDTWYNNVNIENNSFTNYDYGIYADHINLSHIYYNNINNCGYGIFANQYCGTILQNVIDTTDWTGIYCIPKTDTNVNIDGNEIKNTVQVTSGSTYLRCCVFITGTGTVAFRNNTMEKRSGTPLYGLYQAAGVYFIRYYNNIIINPVNLLGGYDPIYCYDNTFL